jgi:predicted DNA-binding transcriptional regulator AlpA
MKPKHTLPTNQPTPDAPREWLRVKEACDYSRLSKPKLYDLMNRGLIKSVSLRERGQIKGTRLVSFDSLRQFLESRASGGHAQA